MICVSCAAGADLRQVVPLPTHEAGRVIAESLMQRVAELHAQCQGCDCQHYGTPSYQPPGTPMPYRTTPPVVNGRSPEQA